jgi:hypothetical protein
MYIFICTFTDVYIHAYMHLQVLKDVEAKKVQIELSTDSNRAALQYFKYKGIVLYTYFDFY